MNKLIIPAILFFAVSVFFACKKAGPEGRYAVAAKVMSAPPSVYAVPGATVYLNYGEETPPENPEEYDMVRMADDKGVAYFPNLKLGTYHLFATAMDTVVDSLVSGTAVVTLVKPDRDSIAVADEGETVVTIPVK